MITHDLLAFRKEPRGNILTADAITTPLGGSTCRREHPGVMLSGITEPDTFSSSRTRQRALFGARLDSETRSNVCLSGCLKLLLSCTTWRNETKRFWVAASQR
ncbi:hypothetical protein BaRGS_00011558 [Batillaria attramentaria]|uniref:Uncharacterized protein n=1 Tax=Batillaria attramentaria TaxID=370345 RepID=A0ABD0LCI7_9CAEN